MRHNRDAMGDVDERRDGTFEHSGELLDAKIGVVPDFSTLESSEVDAVPTKLYGVDVVG